MAILILLVYVFLKDINARQWTASNCGKCCDGQKDGSETAVDCGGSCAEEYHFTCGNGQHCKHDGDCTSGTCSKETHLCVARTPCCASSCTGLFNPTRIGSTCGQYCLDPGGFYCTPDSSVCPGNYTGGTSFNPAAFGGFCNPDINATSYPSANNHYTGPCNTTAGYCCVFDSYAGNAGSNSGFASPNYYCININGCTSAPSNG
jgi:hypothetical protein